MIKKDTRPEQKEIQVYLLQRVVFVPKRKSAARENAQRSVRKLQLLRQNVQKKVFAQLTLAAVSRGEFEVIN